MSNYLSDRYPTDQGGAEGITRLWLLYPDRTLATLMDRFIDFEMNLESLLSGTIAVKMPASHRMFDMNWGGIGILERDLENWGCKFFYRDPGDGSRKKFFGIADPVTIRHTGFRGNAYVEAEFNHAFWELMRRRNVWTVNGGRYRIEDTPDNIVRDLVLKQCCAGTVVTPEGNETDRTRFGPAEAPWSVTCELVKVPGDHPETMRYAVDHGTALTDCLRELFQGRMPITGTSTDIYPEFTESVPGDFRLKVLTGREVVEPRVIGRNLIALSNGTATGSGSAISPERQTMMAFSRKRERTDQITSIEVRGFGDGENQGRRFLADAEMLERVGPIENSWTLPQALVGDDEMEFEARLYLHHRREGTKVTEVELIEQPGRFTYPENVDLADTVTIYSGNDTFRVLENLDVVRVTVTIPVPGYPKVSIGLGQLERNWLAEAGRHGGGRGGGGGGGGRPRNKSGGADGCDESFSCIQDGEGEECIDHCEGRVKFLGDEFIEPHVRGPDGQDPGPPDTDIVVFLEWCAPECAAPNQAAGAVKWANICIRDVNGHKIMLAVPAYECGDPNPAAPRPPPGP